MTHDLVTTLRPLLTAEAAAEAHATGTEPGDLEQAVWLRLLERLATDGPPPTPMAGCAGPSVPRPAAPAVRPAGNSPTGAIPPTTASAAPSNWRSPPHGTAP